MESTGQAVQLDFCSVKCNNSEVITPGKVRNVTCMWVKLFLFRQHRYDRRNSINIHHFKKLHRKTKIRVHDLLEMKIPEWVVSPFNNSNIETVTIQLARDVLGNVSARELQRQVHLLRIPQNGYEGRNRGWVGTKQWKREHLRPLAGGIDIGFILGTKTIHAGS